MLIIVSPAKTLDYETPVKTRTHSQPRFLEDSQQLVKELKRLSPEDLTELMKVSSRIAELNVNRYQNWHTPFTGENSRQAVFAFKGDVYTGMDVDSYSQEDLKFAQKHLRILSGLYGVLRPLDLMQPYRLEMGTRLENPRGRDLYDFWRGKVTSALNEELREQKSNVLINLASNEYFNVIDGEKLNGRIVTPVFKDYKNGKYKVISFYAKKARGMMASYIIKQRVKKVKDLEGFDTGGYRFNPGMSTADQLVFTRDS